MTVDLTVTGGLVLDGGLVRPADVVVDDGRIAAVVPPGEAPTAHQTIEADGLHVLPGLVDAHVHFDEPGRADWEGWASGSLAAAAGGVTTVVDMPIDSDPPVVDADSFRAKVAAASAGSLVDFGLWAGLVPGSLAQLDAMAELGAVGYKAFACDSGWESFPPAGPGTVAAGMVSAAPRDLVVALHAEDPAVLAEEPSRPPRAEMVAVEWAARLAAEAGGRLHIVHVSAAAAVDEAARWPGVTTETCPHYLVLDDDDVAAIGTAALVTPPIRDAANRDLLWQAVTDGRVACIASDHSPCPPGLKEGDHPFAGIAGVETGLSLLLATGRLPLPRLVGLMTAAATLLRLHQKGSIAAGYDADIVLFDPDAQWRLQPSSLHNRHRLTPFTGRPMAGRVHRTLVGGRTVFADGSAASDPQGSQVRPSPAPRPPLG
ncbi:MAG TPA: allantoinase AllB [Acidimicrobiales bacterium]|nr:allantoinase AllB [Acidimicrobiales bacterium]